MRDPPGANLNKPPITGCAEAARSRNGASSYLAVITSSDRCK